VIVSQQARRQAERRGRQEIVTTQLAMLCRIWQRFGFVASLLSRKLYKALSTHWPLPFDWSHFEAKLDAAEQ